jgi:DNA-binding MarR family transcriptional regulator
MEMVMVVGKATGNRAQAQEGFREGTRAVVREEGRLLHKAALLFRAFTNISPTMPIQVAKTFLIVAMNEGASLVEIQRLTGFRQSTISRHLMDLGSRNRKREPGFGLLEIKTDEMDLRKNEYWLTAKGRELVGQVIDVLKV